MQKEKEKREPAHRTWQSRVTHNYRTPVAANTQNNHGKTKWNFVTLCRCLLWLFFSCPLIKYNNLSNANATFYDYLARLHDTHKRHEKSTQQGTSRADLPVPVPVSFPAAPAAAEIMLFVVRFRYYFSVFSSCFSVFLCRLCPFSPALTQPFFEAPLRTSAAHKCSLISALTSTSTFTYAN